MDKENDILALNQELQKLYTQKNQIINRMNNMTQHAQDIANNYNPSLRKDMAAWLKTYDMSNTEWWINADSKRLLQVQEKINEINNKKKQLQNPEPQQEDTKEESTKPNWWWGSKWWGRTRRYRNNNAVKQQEPTYVDPNWVTHTWMTQDEFNQSMQMYEADNQWWYENQRNKTLPWWTTRWQLFDQALNKYLDNPDSFDDSAKQALINVWKQLWYWWDNWQASQQSQPTDQPNVQPTVQPSVQPAQTQSQYNWFDPSQVWWRTWLWTELDRRTQWWQINIPFSL